jgi:hypothetical protein
MIFTKQPVVLRSNCFNKTKVYVVKYNWNEYRFIFARSMDWTGQTRNIEIIPAIKS